MSLLGRVAVGGRWHTGEMNPGDLIQILAVLAAVAASIVALVVSAKDRKNAQTIARDDRDAAARVAAGDRREALRQAHMMFELESLTRLLENLNRGGTSDDLERRRMGAEALTMIGVLGPKRVPHLWEDRAGDDEKLRAHYADPQMPAFKKNAIEVQLAVNALQREILAALSGTDGIRS